MIHVYARVQPQGILGLEKIFKGFYHIYGLGGHLVKWTATILAIFHFPAPGKLQLKSEQPGPEAPEEKSFKILNIFPIQIMKCIGKQT